MSEKEKQILNTFEKVMPSMTEMEKEKLLSFGEGMAFLKEQQQENDIRAALAGRSDAV